MTAILTRHIAFLLPNLVIFIVQGVCLWLSNLALLQLVIDTLILVMQAIIDLISAGMVARPLAVGHRT